MQYIKVAEVRLSTKHEDLPVWYSVLTHLYQCHRCKVCFSKTDDSGLVPAPLYSQSYK